MSYTTVYQIVKYSLISLLSLMIFCTTLAIILVCLASVDYNNNNLNDRSLGKSDNTLFTTLYTYLAILVSNILLNTHFPTEYSVFIKSLSDFRVLTLKVRSHRIFGRIRHTLLNLFRGIRFHHSLRFVFVLPFLFCFSLFCSRNQRIPLKRTFSAIQ